MRMRRGMLLVPAVVGVTMLGTSALASAAPAGSLSAGLPALTLSPAHLAAIHAEVALHARMVARERPHQAVRGPGDISLAGTARSSTTAPPNLTSVQQISQDTLPAAPSIEPDTETEPDISIDPNNAAIMTAVFQVGRDGDNGGAQDGGFATSTNGGHSWTSGNLPDLTTATGGQFQHASDTVVAFGADGSDYAQTIPFDVTDARSGVAVQRSADHGLTFGPPSLVVDDNSLQIFNDKNWITADTNPGSPFRGRIYSVWSRFITKGTGNRSETNSPGAVSYSTDDGKTWSPFVLASAPQADTEGLLPLVHPDGVVTIVYDLFVPAKKADFETAQTSRDGGVTWSQPVTIGQFEGAEVPGMRTGGLPAAAIDPVTGNMYVVWQDTRFNSAGLNDIVLSESTDGGSTWSSPRVVNPEVAGLDRFTPAVAADGGNVYISYRTRGDNGTAPDVSENLVVSTDGGATFRTEQTVGPPTELQFAAVSIEGGPPVAFLGDYMGLAATAGQAQLAWCVASQPPVSGESFHQTTWSGTVTP
ncbi:MAG TPA: sialidase family protein [Mycobacterium sp.]|nr:sialidase family protein [Mycobacterium sp.]